FLSSSFYPFPTRRSSDLLVIFAAVFVSWNISYRNKDFFVLLFLLVAGVFGVFESQDLFFLFFWYEVAVLPMYLLIAVWGASSNLDRKSTRLNSSHVSISY